jgi:hypothetical protein
MNETNLYMKLGQKKEGRIRCYIQATRVRMMVMMYVDAVPLMFMIACH